MAATRPHPDDEEAVNFAMEELLSAIGEEDFAAASKIAAAMQAALVEVSPPS